MSVNSSTMDVTDCSTGGWLLTGLCQLPSTLLEALTELTRVDGSVSTHNRLFLKGSMRRVDKFTEFRPWASSTS